MKLSVNNGSFTYKTSERIILNDISFAVNSGEILTVLGPNGAGKTTLLRSVLGLIEWSSGSTAIDNTDIRDMPYRKLRQIISYVPQSKGTPPSYTVEDMVMLGRASYIGVFSKPGKRDADAVDAALERTGITHLRKRVCSELSGGEYQMVLIARALVSEPKFLILDEPESNLDYQNQLIVMNLIRRLSEDGIACICNTHFPAHALRYGTKALLLARDGTYKFGNVRSIVTENNIKEVYGVRSIIGTLETEDTTYPDIIPIEITDDDTVENSVGTENTNSGADTGSNVIAGIIILTDNSDCADKLNALLHEYRDSLIGRMGLPYHKAKVNIITLILDCPKLTVLELTDRISQIRGTHIKTTYISKGKTKDDR